MRADIQFNKFGYIKRSKGKKALIFTLYFLFVFAVATLCAVYAYFSATAKAEGNMTFGNISVNFLNSDGDFLTNSEFSTSFNTIYPGDTLNLSNIKVKNTGTDNAYVLLNVNVEISATDATTLSYNTWYDVYGQQVNINDMSSNTTAPTVIASGESATTNIKWKVPSQAVDNNYQNATAEVTVAAYGVQTNLEEAKAYVDADLYASYYICKNASTIVETAVGKNLFNINGGFATNNSDYATSVADDQITIAYSRWNSISAEFAQYIKVNSNQKYTIHFNLVQGKARILLRLYDSNKNLINDSSISLQGMTYHTSYTGYYKDDYSNTLTFPENVQYFRILTCAMNYAADDVSIYNNYQVEIGDAATSYEPYKEQVDYVGTQVSGEPLMKVGEVADTIDYTTSTLTRNIKKLELTGNESWQETYAPTILFNLTSANYGLSQEEAIVICSHSPSSTGLNVFGVRITNTAGSCIGFSKCYEGFGVSNLAEFKAYLAEQYAAGTPVTVWYQLATPVTETIFTNKNLYQGPQNLHYQTGTSDFNTNVAATIRVTKNATADYSSTVKELGGDVFNYIYNKNFVISAKIRHYADDNSVGATSTNDFYLYIGYKNGDTILHRKWYSFSKVTDGGYGYYYINNQLALDNVTDLSVVTSITLELRSYSKPGTYRHFEIKEIQIELGTSPTDYQAYDKTTYAYVNGSALRVVGTAKDTYTYDTSKNVGTITRNIGSYEINGNESWSIQISSEYSISKSIINNIVSTYGAENLYCSHFTLTTASSATVGYFRAGTNYLNFNYDGGSGGLTNFTNYLKTQSANGTPVIVWYQLATATTETI